MICHLVNEIVGFSQGIPMATARLVTVTLVNFTFVANPILHRKMLLVRQATVPVSMATRGQSAKLPYAGIIYHYIQN